MLVSSFSSAYRTLFLQGKDALWLARMCVGEGGPRCNHEHAQTMVCTMINRYLLHKWRDRWADDFTDFIRAFSQPINPRWLAGGDLAEKNKGKSSASPRRLARRAKICALTLKDIPNNVVSAVNETYLGICGYNIPYTNWAASTSSIRNKYPEGKEIQGNWFIIDKEIELNRFVMKVAPALTMYNTHDVWDEIGRRLIK